MTAEGRLMVNSCINCGRVFGDAVIDYHRGLAHPPAPYPPVPHSVWYAKDTKRRPRHTMMTEFLGGRT